MALYLLLNKRQKPTKESLSLEELQHMITPYDMGRLKSFTNNMVEYRLIVDLVPTLAKLFFIFKAGGLDSLELSPVHQAMLIGIGLQFKTVDTLASELDLAGKQLLGLFRKMLRQMVDKIEKAKEEAIKNELVKANGTTTNDFRPLSSLTQELNQVADELKKKQKEAFLDENLTQYKIKGSDETWSSTLAKSKAKSLNLVSVKTGEKRAADKVEEKSEEKSVKKQKKFHKAKKLKK